MAILVRYPGRACLLGEHCDWAGGASLTIPLPLWFELSVEPGDQGVRITSELDGELVEGRFALTGPRPQHHTLGPLRFVPAALDALAARGVHPPPARLWGRATLPTGRGFSSSAAFCLALVDGLARHAGRALPPATLIELAYEVEHDRAGVACGLLDPVACAHARPVFLQWTAPPDGFAVRPVEPKGTFHFVVGAFAAPRDTPAILATLSQHFFEDLRDPAGRDGTHAVRVALAAFASAAEVGARALEDGDPWALGDAMNTAQRAYEQHWAGRFPPLRAPQLIRTCAALREQGALGAKFSGAGGDGSVLALFADAEDAHAAVAALSSQGLGAWYVPVSRT